jgi:hypothetical protein
MRQTVAVYRIISDIIFFVNSLFFPDYTRRTRFLEED